MGRIYVDCEFMDDGTTLELLSLAAVKDDGREFYGVNMSADRSRANPWVMEHVLPHLDQFMVPPGDGLLTPVSAGHGRLGSEFYRWAIPDPDARPKAEFWGYYADYDWVAICQLYGKMVDLPPGFPHFAYDLRQWLNEHGYADVRQPEDDVHHALLDARWMRQTHHARLNPTARPQ
jgi:3'-5' exoribonuclease-like protein